MMKKHWNDYWGKYSPIDYIKIAFFLVIILLVSITVIYSARYNQAFTPTQTPIQIPTPTPPQTIPKIETAVEVTKPGISKGNLIVAVKDVKQKLTGTGLGDATELFITIKSVQVHTTTDALENMSVVASGWSTIFEGEKSFDLLHFTDNILLLAEKELEPGSYTQIRLYVSGANIKIDNPLFDIHNKTYPMHIPSNVLKIVRPFSVEPNKTTVLTLDFDVPKMVRFTSQGYTLGPSFKSITDEIKVTEQMIENGKRPENAVET